MPKEIIVKSVLNKSKRRNSWFLDDYTFNPYSSCGFNCLYCYIRGSKYGTNLATSLSVKTNAIELLDKQLSARARKGQYGFIVISSATDPYLRIEKEYELTRRALEVAVRYRFPVHIITKGDLVTRDFDLLQEINEKAILPDDLSLSLDRGALITFSFSTLDDPTGKIFEPGATPPSERFKALEQAVRADFHTGVSMMPLLPYISDTAANLEFMFYTFKAAGAKYLMPATITLFGSGPADSKTLMLRAVAKHYPELVARYEKFFSLSNEMPTYYRDAFYKKMKALSVQYAIPDRIVN